MNIFDKRPLFLIITTLISGFVGFTFGDSLVRGLLIALAVLSLALSLFFYFKKRIKNLLFIILPAALLLSAIYSYVYFDLIFKLYEKYDDEAYIEGKIISIEDEAYTTTVIVKTQRINNKHTAGQKIKLSFSANSLSDEYKTGSKINFQATLCEFENFSDMDATAYYFSDGISADTTDIKNLRFAGQGTTPISVYLTMARNYLADRAAAFAGDRAGSLFSALFLGERDLLGDQIKLDFKRLGITHILALSGLHLSIISMGLSRVLSALGIKKKQRLIIVSVFIILYMLLTGLSVSVVRAGIMLLISSALFLLGKTKDSVTSLGIAVLTIMIVTPYAVYDLALWLSALATLGIVALSEAEEYKPDKTLTKILSDIVFGSLKASLFATSATLLITVCSFKAISVASAVATFVFSILAEIIIYLGMLMLLFGRLIPIGFLLNLVSEATYYLATVMAKPDWIYLSSDFDIVLIAAIVYTVIFAILLVLCFGNKRRASAILAICFIVVIVLSLAVNISTAATDISICDMSNGDRILLRNNSKTMLISMTKQSSSQAYKSYEMLCDYRITNLNIYYIPDYSNGLITGILKMLSLIKVDTLYIPSPDGQDEEIILEDLKDAMRYHSTEICVYTKDDPIEFGDYTITHLYKCSLSQGSYKCAISILHKDINYLYLSAGMLKGSEILTSYSLIPHAQAIIFGSYGTSSTGGYSFDVYNSDIKKIFVGNKKLWIKNAVYVEYKNSGTIIFHDATIDIFN